MKQYISIISVPDDFTPDSSGGFDVTWWFEDGDGVGACRRSKMIPVSDTKAEEEDT